MRKNCCIIVLAISLAITASAQSFPYKDPSLTPSERAKDLLHRLSLSEKISLMRDASPAIPRLGIRPYNWWNEALHGVARAGYATVLPQTIGMAASFDCEAIERAFDAVSNEARAKFHNARRFGIYRRYQGLTFWTPNVNIFRDPRWGRGQETYGEDPYLSARMGVAVVNGLQGIRKGLYDKLHACAKHFAVHSGPEWNRHSFNAENISPRDLWETYLPAFEALIKEADVKEVMCAYNRYEDEPCCGSKRLLQQILREEWGYDGLVVSDCGAIADFFMEKHHETHLSSEAASADAVISGTDLECGSSYKTLDEAVRKKLITEEQIDKSVFRLLKARFELGEMDEDSLVCWSQITMDTVCCPQHRGIALDMARKSMTLLQNNGILPLAKSETKIAVMGPNANDSVMQWGNYNGTPTRTVTILQGIRNKIGNVCYEKGCEHTTNRVFDSQYHYIVDSNGNKGLLAQYWNTSEPEGKPIALQQNSTPLNFNSGGETAFAPGVNLTHFSAYYQGTFYPAQSGNVTLRIEGDDGYRVRVNGKEVINYWGIHSGAKRKYDLTVQKETPYEIEIDYMQAGGEASLSFDIGTYHQRPVAETVSKVKDADIVIFVGGISPQLEGEEMPVNYPGFRGGDRTNIELPIVQRELIVALKAAGKKIIYVNCSGSAMALEPETQLCDAILQAWYPGEEGGTAVADVLFGDYNPAGRLPVTFYRNINQLPGFEDYSMKGRTYRYMRESPLFPFGHGLSYTQFRYGKALLSATTLQVGDELHIKLPITNTGNRKGDEVLQIYIRKPNDKDAPLKTLRAFRRISLNAGETQSVEMTLTSDTFKFFDAQTNMMRVLPGKYELLYGSSSDKKYLNSIWIQLHE